MKYKLILLVVLFFMSCDPSRSTVDIINSSNKTLFLDFTICYSKDDCDLFENNIDSLRHYIIQPKDTLTIGSYAWSTCDTIRINIYNVQLAESTSLRELCLKERFYETLKVHLNDIKGQAITID